MNFISTFDELSKLYEEVAKEEKVEEAEAKEEKVEEACTKEAFTEAADDEEIEIVDDVVEEAPVEEMPAEEPAVDEEPKQVIIECSKCGALVIKDEADIEADEESDLVNVKDECKFCEEKEGYNIVGVVAPYEVVDEADESIEAEEDFFDEESTDDEAVEEGLGDWYRKKFDKPASWITQKNWEEQLEDLYIALENKALSADEKARLEKEVKVIEAKFAQQRDWEKRHAEDSSK